MIEPCERKKLAASNDNNSEQLHRQTGECLLLEERLVVSEQNEAEAMGGGQRYEADYCSICAPSATKSVQELSSVQTEVRSGASLERAQQVNRRRLTPPAESHCRSKLVVCRSCLSDNLNYCEIAKRRQEKHQQQQQKVQQKLLVEVCPNVEPSCSGHELEVEWSKPRGLVGRVVCGLKGRVDGGACTKSLKLKSSRLASGRSELEENRPQDILIWRAIRSLVESIRSLIGDVSATGLSSNKNVVKRELVKGSKDRGKSSNVNSNAQLRPSCSFESSLSSTSLLQIQKSIDSKCDIDLEVFDDSSKTSTPCGRATSKLAPAQNMATTTGSGGNLRSNQEIERVTANEKTPTSLDGDNNNNNNRRSTNSSIGVNEAIFDSSYSSAMNNSESNHTCAINCSAIRNSTERLSNWICHKRMGAKQAKRRSNEAMRNNHKSSNEPHQAQLTSNTATSRDHWKNIEFLLAVIGFAVDLGNVWRFPYICYLNGGGAFLIPYTVMFILGGLPIFYLEMSLGQYFSSGCLTVWRRICPIAKGIGYAMCVLNFYTGLFYNTIISWAVFFFVESFRTTLPWTSCNNSWSSPTCRTIEERQALKTNSSDTLGLSSSPEVGNNSSLQQVVTFSRPTQDYFEREVLQIHLSKGIDDLGEIRKPLALYLAVVFICIYFAIWKGVKSTGKAVWITSLLPYFVLIPLLIRGVFLEGSWGGIRYYLYPDWIKILDVYVWVEAAKQIYFSLGPGFGTLMALSSYNKFNHNCKRDALIAATVNYFASFIAGFVIFSVLGYMAAMENVPLENVATDGPGLVFQVYPEGLATMRFSPMWSILFFMMVITLGIDSTFGGLESVITGLCDEYPRVLRAHRGVFIGFLIIVIYLSSLPTTTYGGNYVMNLIESYGTTLSLLFIVLAETIVVCWVYGADRFCKNLEEMHGQPPGPYWRICWKYISPTILLLIFLAACVQELDKYRMLKFNSYTYPGWATVLGLFMTGSSVCCIPIYAFYHFMTKTTGNSLSERLKTAFRPCVEDKIPLEEFYFDTLTDKITDENKIHPQTVI